MSAMPMDMMPMDVMIDAFYLCLAASIVWAPIVFLGASWLSRRASGAAEAAIWPAALSVAALPAIASPMAAALGLSLRASKPLPPMPAPQTTLAEYVAPAIAMEPQAQTVDLAMILSAVADLYFYGFVLFAMLGVFRLIGFSYRVRYAYPLDNPRLEAGLGDWRRMMDVNRKVRFAYCDAVSAVCVHGFIRPIVLMPPSLLDRVASDDAILMGAHELAHIKRGDTWLFAFCGLAKALFWFNPFMRRIVAHTQLAAEQAADALVIARGANRRSYARCFVESLKATSGLSSPQYALVPSFTPFDKRSRRERLDAILSGKASSLKLGVGAKAGLVASGAVALTLAFGQAALAVAPAPAKQALTELPVEGRITFGFEEKGAVLGKDRPYHEGIDIAAARGTPVRAAGDGKVVEATSRYNGSTAWGKVVVIDHGHGLVTRYAHLNSYIVHKGDSVKAGETIGAVGATGKTKGPHLHFEVLSDGENIDPGFLVAQAPEPPVAPHSMKRKVELAPYPVHVAAAPEAAPTPLTRIEPVPAPDAQTTAPIIAPAADVSPAPVVVPDAPEPPTLGERLEGRLAGRVGEWRAHIDAELSDLDAELDGLDMEIEAVRGLDGMVLRFGDVDLEGFEGAEEFAQKLRGKELKLNEFNAVLQQMPQLAYAWSARELSDAERREIEKEREEARREAKKAQREAQREIAAAQREMQREMAQMQRDREQMQREFERAEEERGLSEEQTRELLEMREEALREAEEQLSREREELERLREDLEEERVKGS